MKLAEKLTWTKPHDAHIRRLRAQGTSWDEIAGSLRVSRWSVIARGQAIGAYKPSVPPPSPAIDVGREPLPTGHAVCWHALIDGTLLAGNAYPWPPLPVER